MGELGFNKFLGAALGTFLFIFALNEASAYIFGGGGHHAHHEYECPNDWAKEKFHGYRVDIPCGSTGGDEPEGPVFDLGLMLASADPAAGEVVLQRQCKTCHTWNEGGANGTGPNLYGVIAKDIASNDSFRYSNALSGVEGEWTYEKMNDWLANPGAFARGTSMAYVGLRSPRRDADRANVIAYLASITNGAPAFPAPLVTEAAAQDDASDTVEGDVIVDGGAVEGAVETDIATTTEEAADPASAGQDLLEAASDEAGNAVDAVQDAVTDAVDSGENALVDAAEGAGDNLLEQATDAVEDAADAVLEDATEAVEEVIDDER